MTIGSQSARSGSGGAELPKKLLSLLMAMVLAFSLVPSAAWAADAASEPSAPAGVAGQDEALEEEPAAVPTEEPANIALPDATTPDEDAEPGAPSEGAEPGASTEQALEEEAGRQQLDEESAGTPIGAEVTSVPGASDRKSVV